MLHQIAKFVPRAAVRHRSACAKPCKDFIVEKCEVVRFFREALQSAGAERKNAHEVAEVMMIADYYGRTVEGLQRLDCYISQLKNGLINGKVRPNIIRETPAVAYLDGCNALGPVIANACNCLAMRKAREMGVGLVCANHSNHFGTMGYYTRQAAKQGLIGLIFGNTPPSVAPAGAKKAALGMNPISMAAPGCGGDDFWMDMATSNTSLGKIETAQKNNQKIPSDWALGSNGKPTTDPAEALRDLALLPLGGFSSGHKGYALALAVEILTGVLADATYGPLGKDLACGDNPPENLAVTAICVEPMKFANDFNIRLSSLMRYLRQMEPADVSRPVQVPGDPQREVYQANLSKGGILYVPTLVNEMKKIAECMKIKPMQRLENF